MQDHAEILVGEDVAVGEGAAREVRRAEADGHGTLHRARGQASGRCSFLKLVYSELRLFGIVGVVYVRKNLNSSCVT